MDIGELLLNFFWGITDLIKGLFNLFSVQITLPGFVETIIQMFNPNFTMPAISVMSLISGAGALILLALSVYYIIKSPV